MKAMMRQGWAKISGDVESLRGKQCVYQDESTRRVQTMWKWVPIALCSFGKSVGNEVLGMVMQEISPWPFAGEISPRMTAVPGQDYLEFRSISHRGQFGEDDRPCRLILIRNAITILLIPDDGFVGLLLWKDVCACDGGECRIAVLEPIRKYVATSRWTNGVGGAMRRQGWMRR